MNEAAGLDRAYRPWQVRIFGATWLAYAGYYFCRKTFYVVKADLGLQLGLSASDLADFGTAYLVAYMVGQFSSASLGRWLGPKRLLLAGMGISVLSNVFLGFGNAYHTIFQFMALNGLAQGTGWPGCIGSLAYWFRRTQRGSVLGIWSTCYQVGSLAASAFAAYVLGRWGWRWSFFAGSAVLTTVWFLVAFLHPNRPEDVGLDPLEEDTLGGVEPPSEPGAGRGLGWDRRVLGTILLMGSIYFTIKFLRYTLWSWVPFFLRRNHNLAGDVSGYLSVAFDLAGILGVLFAGFVSDRIFRGRRAGLSALMILGMTGGFASLYFLGSRSVPLFVASLAVVGFSLFGPDSLLSGVGAIDVGSKRGALAAAGIINGMGSAGPIVQEKLVAFLYERFGRSEGPVFAFLLGMALLSTVLTTLLWLRARAGKADI